MGGLDLVLKKEDCGLYFTSLQEKKIRWTQRGPF